MKVKQGATIEGCSGEILKGAILIEPLFNNAGIEMVITSGTRENHRADRSGHYRGDAIDVRSNTLKGVEKKKALLRSIKRKLGPAYVVILESIGKPWEHYHIHWSPTQDSMI